MKVDGKHIAQEILEGLKKRVRKLKKKGLTPHLHIITLTTDEASQAYVGQKRKKGGEIGAKITVENLSSKTKTEELLKKIEKLNNDKIVHGIIVQRPLPKSIDEAKISNSINPKKDVDGFHPKSKFSPPVGKAVIRILEEVYEIKSQIQNSKFQINSKTQNPNYQNILNFGNSNLDIISDLDIRYSDLNSWLKAQRICVIGRGITAGDPILKILRKTRSDLATLATITSKTENRKEILRNSDVIISAVGKPNIIVKSDIKKGVILIGVGMFRGEDGKFHSDYEEADIKNIASFYTPTPGGVGPINVAMLLSNLITATENQFLPK